jgi:hypothetical protein
MKTVSLTQNKKRAVFVQKKQETDALVTRMVGGMKTIIGDRKRYNAGGETFRGLPSVWIPFGMKSDGRKNHAW